MGRSFKTLPILGLAGSIALGACATDAGSPRRFATVPAAEAAECEVVRAALIGVLSQEPFYAKPPAPPLISYIALKPELVAEEFEETPYEGLEMAPVNLSGCIGEVRGPRLRVMGFTYPNELKTEPVTDNKVGWVSRPVIAGDKATVLLSRGACYRTATIELARDGAGWRPSRISHSDPDITWTGKHPCDAPASS